MQLQARGPTASGRCSRWSGLLFWPPNSSRCVCGGGASVILIPTFSLPSPRWLSYLLLFILDLVICLVTCLGLARRSKCLLAS